ncbi:MAG: hypothetical protein GSR73_03015, partial [Desulfurococcales archaeon]|nr:hypothetical protein [Desulfurococcales archaeon]
MHITGINSRLICTIPRRPRAYEIRGIGGDYFNFGSCAHITGVVEELTRGRCTLKGNGTSSKEPLLAAIVLVIAVT